MVRPRVEEGQQGVTAHPYSADTYHTREQNPVEHDQAIDECPQPSMSAGHDARTKLCHGWILGQFAPQFIKDGKLWR